MNAENCRKSIIPLYTSIFFYVFNSIHIQCILCTDGDLEWNTKKTSHTKISWSQIANGLVALVVYCFQCNIIDETSFLWDFGEKSLFSSLVRMHVFYIRVILAYRGSINADTQKRQIDWKWTNLNEMTMILTNENRLRLKCMKQNRGKIKAIWKDRNRAKRAKKDEYRTQKQNPRAKKR